MSYTSLICAKTLSKWYNNQTHALDGLDLSIGEGEWVSMMGPSGSGKTTFLNILACLDRPSSGSLTVDRVDITKLRRSDLARFRRERIGLVFQQFHLVPYLSALENVMLAQYFHSMADEKEAKEALVRVGLEHRMRHRPSQLSGGEQQRVCIARALINDPRILLADEPTGNLDQENSALILALFNTLHREGRTIVMVTHDPTVAALGDRTVRLLDGKLLSSARSESARPSPKALLGALTGARS